MSDVRFALRSLRTNPGFSAVVILMLALGIGASTTVFSIVDGVLTRPLLYREPDRIVRLSEGYEDAVPRRTGARLGSVTYHAWKDAGPQTVSAMEGYTEPGEGLVEIDGGRSLVPTARVTPGLLALLGASPELGRLFADNDAAEGSEPVVVLTNRFWRERFEANPDAVGRTVAISGERHRVIGVTPPAFGFPDNETRLWAILDVPRPTGPAQNPAFNTFFALARLSPGATPDQAAAEAMVIARSIDPKPLAARITFGDGGAAFVRATPMLDELTSGVKTAVIVVAAGVACLLLIVCMNVSNLLLSRNAARHRELAVRRALGARWMALARHLLAESVLLSLAGGAAGVGLAFWVVRALPLIVWTDFPRIENVQLNLRVLAAAALLSMLTALLSALAPILGLARIDVARAFRGEGASGAVARVVCSRTRSVLLATESAFTVMLLVAAMLVGRSFLKLTQVDAGYTREDVIVADVLRPDTTEASARRYAPLMREALDRVRSLPGVAAAAIGSMSPLDDNTSLQGFPVPGSLPAVDVGSGTGVAPRTALTRSYAVSPGYDLAMGLRLRAGRFFIDSDATGDDVRWVVNEEFARLYLPPNPVGRRFPWRRRNQNVQLEIVGVVGNVLKDGNTDAPSPEVYGILRNSEPFFNYQIIARTTADVDAIAPAMRNAIRDAASDATINLMPLTQRFSESVAQPRLATTVFAALAVLAGGLTAIGLFAALSYSLSQRRHEFGVRVAVGATRLHLIRLVVRQGIAPTTVGIVIGVVAAAAATRFMRAVLFGVVPLDAVSFIAAPSLLVPVALAACLLPAFRAARIDPMTALRVE